MDKGTTPGNNSVALIAGPTASGKSAAALDLAKKLDKQGRKAAIINADSMQVYSDIPVLSAAPSADELKQCDHRLYGAWDGKDACSVADWAARASAEITDCHDHDVVPILVGGTGMYLKVLIEGIAPIPAIDPEVREVVRSMDIAAAYAALLIEDPVRAAELEPTDSQRIARALEVKRSTGVTMGDWHQAKTGGIGDHISLHAAVMMPPRQWVYDRCDTRFAAMMDNGAIDEVESLLSRKLAPDLPVMRAIGVPEVTRLISKEATLDDVVTAGAQSTRNYAKRQFTWLRNQSPTDWIKCETESVDIKKLFALLLRI